MPVSGGGFAPADNVQAAVDAETRLVLATGVTQQTHDQQQVEPMLAALPDRLGQVDSAAMDNGYCSATNVKTGLDRDREPLIAWSRDAHHLPRAARCGPAAPEPQTAAPVVRMAWRLKTKAGRARYAQRTATVEPVLGIIKQVMGFRQFSRRGLAAVAGEWTLVTLAFNRKRMPVLNLA